MRIIPKGNFSRTLVGLIFILSVAFGIRLSFSQTHSEMINGLSDPYASPEIGGISTWLNSPPLTIHQLKGKVILVDFWTYSCVNCLRTLPYLKTWYQKYHDQGFEMIGVHSPEFEFEKKVTNVKNAVKKWEIIYPVALDNQYVTWKNFKNNAWPAHFLIDQQGKVVYEHFGEGEYDTTENNIRLLLGLNKLKSHSDEPHYTFQQTPETYLGYARAENFVSPQEIIKGRPQQYSFPETFSKNEWGLQGIWIVGPEYVISQNNASLKIHFFAKNVFAVMGSTNKKSMMMKIMLNGKFIKNLLVDEHRLYEVINLKEASEGTLEIIPASPGLQVYTFTFGS